jgi:hypothetical protein
MALAAAGRAEQQQIGGLVEPGVAGGERHDLFTRTETAIAKLDKYHLLILDDLAYVTKDPTDLVRRLQTKQVWASLAAQADKEGWPAARFLLRSPSMRWPSALVNWPCASRAGLSCSLPGQACPDARQGSLLHADPGSRLHAV